MKHMYRGFIALMILLVVLGVALLFYGAWQNDNRPRTPVSPDGIASIQPTREWERPYV